MEKVRISDFYKGKDIFITGGTGFVGKSLIEKLLRSCPGIGDVYVLMRPKKGNGLPARIDQLREQPVFERLKNERPGLLERKLKGLAGDVTKINLGLSNQDRQTVTDRVSVIFHVAASVRFDDPLRDAIIMNVRGTREACQLALDTRNLAVFVHVSTAYTNCDRFDVSEVLYAPKADWRQTIAVAEHVDPYVLDVLTNKYMEGMPNTYTFTKGVAEHAVRDLCEGRIPVKIVRPSIVVSSLEEPVKGWIDNFNGPVGILTAYGKGIMRTIYARTEVKSDYIPIDVVTKAVVVASWDLALRGNVSEVEVMHCTSHDIMWSRPTFDKLAAAALEISRDVPLNDVMWVPSGHTSTHAGVVYVRTVLFQLLPALLIDLGLWASGRKTFLTKIQRKIYVAQLALRHFMNNEWTYSNKKFMALQKRVLPADMADFDYNYDEGDFTEYIRNSILGCRKFLLNESEQTLPKAKRHLRRMILVDRIARWLVYALFVWMFYKMDIAQMFTSKMPDLC